eukprot:3495534-Rhodomonas_salina.1
MAVWQVGKGGRYRHLQQGYNSAIRLRGCYAMPGTDVVGSRTSVRAGPATRCPYPSRCAPMPTGIAYGPTHKRLRARYAKSDSFIAHVGARASGLVLT